MNFAGYKCATAATQPGDALLLNNSALMPTELWRALSLVIVGCISVPNVKEQRCPMQDPIERSSNDAPASADHPPNEVHFETMESVTAVLE